jgi:hypothetical protein
VHGLLRWLTAMKGLSNSAEAKAFPKLNPIDKHTTIRPGPAVEATASISSIFLPLLSIAF